MGNKYNIKDLMREVLVVIEQASNRILEIYAHDFDIYTKDDHSVVTKADIASNQIIANGLKCFGFPIVSEESPKVPNIDDIDCFWLVDPLDGTKEFINKLDEFTVNIALVKDGVVVLGAVSVPAKDTIYYAYIDGGAYKRHAGNTFKINSSSVLDIRQATAAFSRSHLSANDRLFIEDNCIKSILFLGSALKYCYVAEAKVDLVVRYTPLMSWDIAASDIIVRQSGGTITNLAKCEICYTDVYKPFTSGILVTNSFINVDLFVNRH